MPAKTAYEEMEDLITTVFYLLDVSQDGTLSIDECGPVLRYLAQAIGSFLSPNELDEIFRESAGSDSKIDLDEFHDHMQGLLESCSKPKKLQSALIEFAAKKSFEQNRWVFVPCYGHELGQGQVSRISAGAGGGSNGNANKNGNKEQPPLNPMVQKYKQDPKSCKTLQQMKQLYPNAKSGYWYNTKTHNVTPVGWPNQPADHLDFIEVPFLTIPIHQTDGYRNFPNDSRCNPFALATTLKNEHALLKKADLGVMVGNWVVRDLFEPGSTGGFESPASATREPISDRNGSNSNDETSQGAVRFDDQSTTTGAIDALNSWDITITKDFTFNLQENQFAAEPLPKERFQMCLPNDVIPFLHFKSVYPQFHFCWRLDLEQNDGSRANMLGPFVPVRSEFAEQSSEPAPPTLWFQNLDDDFWMYPMDGFNQEFLSASRRRSYLGISTAVDRQERKRKAEHPFTLFDGPWTLYQHADSVNLAASAVSTTGQKNLAPALADLGRVLKFRLTGGSYLPGAGEKGGAPTNNKQEAGDHSDQLMELEICEPDSVCPHLHMKLPWCKQFLEETGDRPIVRLEDDSELDKLMGISPSAEDQTEKETDGKKKKGKSPRSRANVARKQTAAELEEKAKQTKKEQLKEIPANTKLRFIPFQWDPYQYKRDMFCGPEGILLEKRFDVTQFDGVYLVTALDRLDKPIVNDNSKAPTKFRVHVEHGEFTFPAEIASPDVIQTLQLSLRPGSATGTSAKAANDAIRMKQIPANADIFFDLEAPVTHFGDRGEPARYYQSLDDTYEGLQIMDEDAEEQQAQQNKQAQHPQTKLPQFRFELDRETVEEEWFDGAFSFLLEKQVPFTKYDGKYNFSCQLEQDSLDSSGEVVVKNGMFTLLFVNPDTGNVTSVKSAFEEEKPEPTISNLPQNENLNPNDVTPNLTPRPRPPGVTDLEQTKAMKMNEKIQPVFFHFVPNDDTTKCVLQVEDFGELRFQHPENANISAVFSKIHDVHENVVENVAAHSPESKELLTQLKGHFVMKVFAQEERVVNTKRQEKQLQMLDAEIEAMSMKDEKYMMPFPDLNDGEEDQDLNSTTTGEGGINATTDTQSEDKLLFEHDQTRQASTGEALNLQVNVDKLGNLDLHFPYQPTMKGVRFFPPGANNLPNFHFIIPEWNHGALMLPEDVSISVLSAQLRERESSVVIPWIYKSLRPIVGVGDTLASSASFFSQQNQLQRMLLSARIFWDRRFHVGHFDGRWLLRFFDLDLVEEYEKAMEQKNVIQVLPASPNGNRKNNGHSPRGGGAGNKAQLARANTVALQPPPPLVEIRCSIEEGELILAQREDIATLSAEEASMSLHEILFGKDYGDVTQMSSGGTSGSAGATSGTSSAQKNKKNSSIQRPGDLYGSYHFSVPGANPNSNEMSSFVFDASGYDTEQPLKSQLVEKTRQMGLPLNWLSESKKCEMRAIFELTPSFLDGRYVMKVEVNSGDRILCSLKIEHGVCKMPSVFGPGGGFGTTNSLISIAKDDMQLDTTKKEDSKKEHIKFSKTRVALPLRNRFLGGTGNAATPGSAKFPWFNPSEGMTFELDPAKQAFPKQMTSVTVKHEDGTETTAKKEQKFELKQWELDPSAVQKLHRLNFTLTSKFFDDAMCSYGRVLLERRYVVNVFDGLWTCALVRGTKQLSDLEQTGSPRGDEGEKTTAEEQKQDQQPASQKHAFSANRQQKVEQEKSLTADKPKLFVNKQAQEAQELKETIEQMRMNFKVPEAVITVQNGIFHMNSLRKVVPMDLFDLSMHALSDEFCVRRPGTGKEPEDPKPKEYYFDTPDWTRFALDVAESDDLRKIMNRGGGGGARTGQFQKMKTTPNLNRSSTVAAVVGGSKGNKPGEPEKPQAMPKLVWRNSAQFQAPKMCRFMKHSIFTDLEKIVWTKIDVCKDFDGKWTWEIGSLQKAEDSITGNKYLVFVPDKGGDNEKDDGEEFSFDLRQVAANAEVDVKRETIEDDTTSTFGGASAVELQPEKEKGPKIVRTTTEMVLAVKSGLISVNNEKMSILEKDPDRVNVPRYAQSLDDRENFFVLESPDLEELRKQTASTALVSTLSTTGSKSGGKYSRADRLRGNDKKMKNDKNKPQVQGHWAANVTELQFRVQNPKNEEDRKVRMRWRREPEPDAKLQKLLNAFAGKWQLEVYPLFTSNEPETILQTTVGVDGRFKMAGEIFKYRLKGPDRRFQALHFELPDIGSKAPVDIPVNLQRRVKVEGEEDDGKKKAPKPLYKMQTANVAMNAFGAVKALSPVEKTEKPKSRPVSAMLLRPSCNIGDERMVFELSKEGEGPFKIVFVRKDPFQSAFGAKMGASPAAGNNRHRSIDIASNFNGVYRMCYSVPRGKLGLPALNNSVVGTSSSGNVATASGKKSTSQVLDMTCPVSVDRGLFLFPTAEAATIRPADLSICETIYFECPTQFAELVVKPFLPVNRPGSPSSPAGGHEPLIPESDLLKKPEKYIFRLAKGARAESTTLEFYYEDQALNVKISIMLEKIAFLDNLPVENPLNTLMSPKLATHLLKKAQIPDPLHFAESLVIKNFLPPVEAGFEPNSFPRQLKNLPTRFTLAVYCESERKQFRLTRVPAIQTTSDWEQWQLGKASCAQLLNFGMSDMSKNCVYKCPNQLQVGSVLQFRLHLEENTVNNLPSAGDNATSSLSDNNETEPFYYWRIQPGKNNLTIDMELLEDCIMRLGSTGLKQMWLGSSYTSSPATTQYSLMAEQNLEFQQAAFYFKQQKGGLCALPVVQSYLQTRNLLPIKSLKLDKPPMPNGKFPITIDVGAMENQHCLGMRVVFLDPLGFLFNSSANAGGAFAKTMLASATGVAGAVSATEKSQMLLRKRSSNQILRTGGDDPGRLLELLQQTGLDTIVQQSAPASNLDGEQNTRSVLCNLDLNSPAVRALKYNSAFGGSQSTAKFALGPDDEANLANPGHFDKFELVYLDPVGSFYRRTQELQSQKSNDNHVKHQKPEIGLFVDRRKFPALLGQKPLPRIAEDEYAFKLIDTDAEKELIDSDQLTREEIQFFRNAKLHLDFSDDVPKVLGAATTSSGSKGALVGASTTDRQLSTFEQQQSVAKFPAGFSVDLADDDSSFLQDREKRSAFIEFLEIRRTDIVPAPENNTDRNPSDLKKDLEFYRNAAGPLVPGFGLNGSSNGATSGVKFRPGGAPADDEENEAVEPADPELDENGEPVVKEEAPLENANDATEDDDNEDRKEQERALSYFSTGKQWDKYMKLETEITFKCLDDFLRRDVPDTSYFPHGPEPIALELKERSLALQQRERNSLRYYNEDSGNWERENLEKLFPTSVIYPGGQDNRSESGAPSNKNVADQQQSPHQMKSTSSSKEHQLAGAATTNNPNVQLFVSNNMTKNSILIKELPSADNNNDGNPVEIQIDKLSPNIDCSALMPANAGNATFRVGSRLGVYLLGDRDYKKNPLMIQELNPDASCLFGLPTFNRIVLDDDLLKFYKQISLNIRGGSSSGSGSPSGGAGGSSSSPSNSRNKAEKSALPLLEHLTHYEAKQFALQQNLVHFPPPKTEAEKKDMVEEQWQADTLLSINKAAPVEQPENLHPKDGGAPASTGAPVDENTQQESTEGAGTILHQQSQISSTSTGETPLGASANDATVGGITITGEGIPVIEERQLISDLCFRFEERPHSLYAKTVQATSGSSKNILGISAMQRKKDLPVEIFNRSAEKWEKYQSVEEWLAKLGDQDMTLEPLLDQIQRTGPLMVAFKSNPSDLLTAAIVTTASSNSHVAAKFVDTEFNHSVFDTPARSSSGNSRTKWLRVSEVGSYTTSSSTVAVVDPPAGDSENKETESSATPPVVSAPTPRGKFSGSQTIQIPADFDSDAGIQHIANFFTTKGASSSATDETEGAGPDGDEAEKARQIADWRFALRALRQTVKKITGTPAAGFYVVTHRIAQSGEVCYVLVDDFLPEQLQVLHSSTWILLKVLLKIYGRKPEFAIQF
ncbi:unnamed protein product [Amoebophrya sp. A120]|nr:unnamed protein product [Amoebophrya sp. A120]|eukprot:GSA120T00004343001.1